MKFKITIIADTKYEDPENYDSVFRTYVLDSTSCGDAALEAGDLFREENKKDFDITETNVTRIED